MSGAAARRLMHKYGLPSHFASNLTNDQLVLMDEINPSTIISTLTFMNGFVCVGFLGIRGVEILFEKHAQKTRNHFLACIRSSSSPIFNALLLRLFCKRLYYGRFATRLRCPIGRSNWNKKTSFQWFWIFVCGWFFDEKIDFFEPTI